jgi:hypothetical protein
VMIETMVVPALDTQLLAEILDHGLPQEGRVDSLYRISMSRV